MDTDFSSDNSLALDFKDFNDFLEEVLLVSDFFEHETVLPHFLGSTGDALLEDDGPGVLALGQVSFSSLDEDRRQRFFGAEGLGERMSPSSMQSSKLLYKPKESESRLSAVLDFSFFPFLVLSVLFLDLPLL